MPYNTNPFAVSCMVLKSCLRFSAHYQHHQLYPYLLYFERAFYNFTLDSLVSNFLLFLVLFCFLGLATCALAEILVLVASDLVLEPIMGVSFCGVGLNGLSVNLTVVVAPESPLLTTFPSHKSAKNLERSELFNLNG